MKRELLALLSTLIVGGVFIASAILKIYSIDTFELYIYSFGLFDLNLSALAARVVIGGELALGVGYITNLFHRPLFYTLLTTLVGFTLFLGYLTIVGNNDNCHCFGDIVELSPIESILKNILIIAILILSRNTPEWKFRAKWWMVVAPLIVVALIPSMIVPHRALYSTFAQSEEGKKINVELFEAFLEEHPELEWGSKIKILALYGTSCKYCKITAHQFSQIIDKNSLPTEGIHILFWGSDESKAEEFLSETDTQQINYTMVAPTQLLNICNGKVPTLIFYDESREHNIALYGVRTLDERAVVERLE